MISKISKDIWQLSFNSFGSAVYLIKLTDENILIDTSSKENEKELLIHLKELKLSPEDISTLIITHFHWDHTGNNALFKKAKIYNYENIKELNQPLFKIINTPGHTKDSICILYKDVLFSGDTLFHEGGIGRTDFKESVPEEMEESLNKLKKLNYKILCPGHV